MSLITTIVYPATTTLAPPKYALALTTVFTPPAACQTKWVQPTITKTPGAVTNVFSGELDHTVSSYRAGYYVPCHQYDRGSAVWAPGVCPSGKTLGRIYESRLDVTTSLQNSDRLWEGLCCDSGFTVSDGGVLGFEHCVKTFTTPFTAFKVKVTTELQSFNNYSPAPLTFWDTTIKIYTTTHVGGSTVTTTKNVTATEKTAVPSGVAYGLPEFVYWRKNDLTLFPSAYASSVASVIGVQYPPPTAAARAARDPGPTAAAAEPVSAPPLMGRSVPEHTGPSVGLPAVGVVLLGATAISYFLRKRGKKAKQRSRSAASVSA